MRVHTKSAAAMTLTAMATMTAACGGHGANSYLMPKDAVVTKLTGAQKEFSYGGNSTQSITSVSKSGDTIRVRISSNGGGMTPPLCEARVEAIDEEWTRVTPSCTAGETAIDQTIGEIYEKHVDEFVIAVLHNREIDSEMIRKRMGAVAIDNMGEMRREVASLAEEEFAKSDERAASAQRDAQWRSDDADGGWGN